MLGRRPVPVPLLSIHIFETWYVRVPEHSPDDPSCLHLVLNRYGGELVGLSAGAQLGGYKLYCSFWIPATCIEVCTGSLLTFPGLISDFSFSVLVSGPSLSCTESGVLPCQHCMARSSAACSGRPSLVARTVELQIRPESYHVVAGPGYSFHTPCLLCLCSLTRARISVKAAGGILRFG